MQNPSGESTGLYDPLKELRRFEATGKTHAPGDVGLRKPPSEDPRSAHEEHRHWSGTPPAKPGGHGCVVATTRQGTRDTSNTDEHLAGAETSLPSRLSHLWDPRGLQTYAPSRRRPEGALPAAGLKVDSKAYSAHEANVQSDSTLMVEPGATWAAASSFLHCLSPPYSTRRRPRRPRLSTSSMSEYVFAAWSSF